MRFCLAGKALLLAAAALLVLWYTPGNAVQSMTQSWFRSKMNKLRERMRWMKSPKPVPLTEVAKINTLQDLVARLNFAGFKGPRTADEYLEVFETLKSCFRNFSPPAGLALDFSPDTTMGPDDKIKRLFTFVPPAKFIHDPMLHVEAQTNFVEMASDETAGSEGAAVPAPVVEEDQLIAPLRLVKFASDSKHILASIVMSVYRHFRSPSCQQAGKRLDGLRRILLRKNAKVAALEPLLIFALVQGNAVSAGKFEQELSVGGELENQRSKLQVPANISSNPGVYDPALLVAYYDLVKASDTPHMKKLEKLLNRPVDEAAVAAKLFGNALANPTTHKKVTGIGKAVGTDDQLLQQVVERLGFMAMDSADAASILLPNYPNVAALIRGVTFFAFENVFKQHGPYAMPGLPCGDNLTGNMLETLTRKKLGKNYYVYKYLEPVLSTPELPENVWKPDPESHLAQYLMQNHKAEGEYVYAHAPRVCTRTALFEKCSKHAPAKVETSEEQLCQFINTHKTLFFKVDGKGVYALRKAMQSTLPAGRIERARNALARGMRSIRRFLFSKTSVALMLGAGVGAICVAAGLTGAFAGSLCAVGALGAASLFKTLFAVAPFGTKPALPLSVGAFLATDFERHLDLTTRMLPSVAITTL